MLDATGTIEREAGSITVTPLFASAGPLPALDEARLPDAQINGVDQRNLTVGQVATPQSYSGASSRPS